MDAPLNITVDGEPRRRSTSHCFPLRRRGLRVEGRPAPIATFVMPAMDTQLIESMGESWNVVDLFEALHQSVDSASRRNQLRRRQPQREQAQGRPPAAPVGSRHDFGIRTHRGWSIRCLRFAIDG
jgi:hypothetical protein